MSENVRQNLCILGLRHVACNAGLTQTSSRSEQRKTSCNKKTGTVYPTYNNKLGVSSFASFKSIRPLVPLLRILSFTRLGCNDGSKLSSSAAAPVGRRKKIIHTNQKIIHFEPQNPEIGYDFGQKILGGGSHLKKLKKDKKIKNKNKKLPFLEEEKPLRNRSRFANFLKKSRISFF